MSWQPVTRDDQWKLAVLDELRAIRQLLSGSSSFPPAPEIKEPTSKVYPCNKCGKVLTSNAGRAGHERFCKKGA